VRNPRELELLRLAGATFTHGGYDVLRDALLEGGTGPGPLKDCLALDATMRDPKVAPTPALERRAERLDYLHGATWKHAVQAPTRGLFRGLPGHCVRTKAQPGELGRPLAGPVLSLELGPRPAHELTSLVDSPLAQRLLHLTVWGRGSEPMEAAVLVSPAFASLDSLALPLTQEVLAALAGSPRLGAIKSLRLTGGSVNLSTNGKLVARLCELPLASLEALTLTHMPLDARGLAALATGPAVSSLAFERCDLTDDILPALARGHLLAGVTRLRFARDHFSDQGLATVLGACPRLQRFELEDLVTPRFD
jgi:hypothetical protein